MRKYTNIDRYLNTLASDIYPQPLDPLHTERSEEVIMQWCDTDIKTILDVGCGQGVAFPYFKKLGLDFTAITLGLDYQVCRREYPKDKVHEMDMHFLDFPDESFDMVYARHILEHSTMPLLALMEWHRVSKDRLVVVIPSPKEEVIDGRNHYSMLPRENWRSMFKRAGWAVREEDRSCRFEYRYLLVKKPYIESEQI